MNECRLHSTRNRWYYQVYERLDDTAPAPTGEKVAGKVKTAFGDAVASVVRFFCVCYSKVLY